MFSKTNDINRKLYKALNTVELANDLTDHSPKRVYYLTVVIKWYMKLTCELNQILSSIEKLCRMALGHRLHTSLCL